jgi:hypothetical protein
MPRGTDTLTAGFTPYAKFHPLCKPGVETDVKEKGRKRASRASVRGFLVEPVEEHIHVTG